MLASLKDFRDFLSMVLANFSHVLLPKKHKALFYEEYIA
jgi:hypothetical protein